MLFKNNTNMDPYWDNSATSDVFKKLPDDPDMD
jgi:hypothetical protein